MMTFRGSGKRHRRLPAISEATHLLEGAVRREGEDVRVTVRLIDAPDDRQVWTQTFARRLGTAMTLQAEVAEEVAARLAVELTGEGVAPPATTSPVAYDLYLRAKLASQEVTQRTPPEETRRIEQWLNEAIALDPAFGVAYVERARIRIVRFVRNQDLSSANTQGAQADIATAQRLLGDRAEVAAIQSRYLAAVHDDLRLAVQRLESPAVTASRDPAVMLWRAFALCRADRPEEGLRVYAQVAELDPLNRGIFSSWAIELWSMRRPAEALRVIESFNRRGVGRIDYGDLEFAFTGRVDRLRRDVEDMDASADPDARLAATFDLLRFERRFADLRTLVLGASVTTLRQRGFREQQAAGISDKPVAELRGWSALLSGDRTAMEATDKALLDYANREPFHGARRSLSAGPSSGGLPVPATTRKPSRTRAARWRNATARVRHQHASFHRCDRCARACVGGCRGRSNGSAERSRKPLSGARSRRNRARFAVLHPACRQPGVSGVG